MNLSGKHVCMAALMPHAPVLVPAVGGARGNRAAASVNAMAEVARRLVQAKPDAVALISPHLARRRGAFAIWAGGRVGGSLAQFGAPEVTVDLPADEPLAGRIAGEAGSHDVKTWRLQDEELDHGAVVPLWHLADAGWRGPAVVLGLNYPNEPGVADLGKAIAAAAEQTGRRIAVIASGDMSHRLQHGAPAGFHPRAREFDHAFIECLRAGDYRRLPDFAPELQGLAAEDALDSTLAAVAAVDWSATGHEVLSYEGPFGVGYGVAILHVAPAETAPDGGSMRGAQTKAGIGGGQMLPRVAWRSIAASLRGGEGGPEAAAEGILGERHGVFVTLCGPGRELRGCVGTLKPKFENIVEETWHVARDAAFHDGRFAPVSADELDELYCEVSVILGLEDVASASELDTARYGVVVTAGDGRRGVLLPGIPEIETVEQQLAIARRKGGIGESEPVRLQRFTVEKFGGRD